MSIQPDPGAPQQRARRALHADWRVWLGLSIAVAALVYTLHDVNLSDVWQSIAGADLWVLPVLIALQFLTMWIRSLRWRHLTTGLADTPLPIGALLRATLVGFMGINLLPFRFGELARPWFLSHETGVSGSAALGTVVLDRALDFTALAAVGGFVLYFHTATLPVWVRSGALAIAALGLLPLGLIVALKLNEQGTMRRLFRMFALVPERLRTRSLGILTEVFQGLNSLHTLRTTALVLWESFLLWGLVLPATYLLGLLAFGVDLPVGELVLAAYTAHVFIALAVAAPAAPGFFGVYHFAAREALLIFGVSSATAVGFGTLLHLSYWVPITLAGLFAMIHSGIGFGELTRVRLGKARPDAHR